MLQPQNHCPFDVNRPSHNTSFIICISHPLPDENYYLNCRASRCMDIITQNDMYSLITTETEFTDIEWQCCIERSIFVNFGLLDRNRANEEVKHEFYSQCIYCTYVVMRGWIKSATMHYIRAKYPQRGLYQLPMSVISTSCETQGRALEWGRTTGEDQWRRMD